MTSSVGVVSSTSHGVYEIQMVVSYTNRTQAFGHIYVIQRKANGSFVVPEDIQRSLMADIDGLTPWHTYEPKYRMVSDLLKQLRALGRSQEWVQDNTQVSTELYSSYMVRKISLQVHKLSSHN